MAICDVPRETEERLGVYAELLTRWNGTIELVSRRMLANLRQEIIECSELLQLVSSNTASALDIGSGGGLPALPMAIAGGIEFTLVEADARKAAFLREAARHTSAPVRVLATRIEDVALAPYDLITSRAFAPLDTLLNLAATRQHNRTVCIFPKGASVGDEVRAADKNWRFEAELIPTRRGYNVIVRHLTARFGDS